MSELPPLPGLPEEGETPPATGEQLVALFDAINAYNENREGFLHTTFMQSLDLAIQKEPDYNLLRRLDDIDEEAHEGYALGRELLHLLHDPTLRASGLGLCSSDYLMPCVVDGLALARSLATPPVETERLCAHLQTYVDDWILLIRDTSIVDNRDRASALAGELPAKPIRYSNETEQAEDTHTVGQLLQHGSILAERLDALGVTEHAHYLRIISNFAAEDDIVPWAIASHYGLLPESAPLKDPTLGHWLSWRQHEEWQPLFRLLRAANPIGTFGPHLKRSALAMVEHQMTNYLYTINKEFSHYESAYREMETRWIDLNKDAADLHTPTEELRNSFITQRAEGRLQLEQLTRVRDQLQNFQL